MPEEGAKASVSPPRWAGLHSEYSPPKAGPEAAGDPGTRSETRRPHLVNYGASRLSSSVSFIPLPEHGRLVIGLPERQLPARPSVSKAWAWSRRTPCWRRTAAACCCGRRPT
ncbi:uncharacterized protein LOC119103566 [Pollicipes pollicipes]|uniref:uncharacterized protein LOC119103566 n=1 Tax=Pollicipes pollicipes TaxID=41117 RepID=UPI0018855876|nr:uncharacterized protein LOC119103566 [Pollicipes pollicipes]